MDSVIKPKTPVRAVMNIRCQHPPNMLVPQDCDGVVRSARRAPFDEKQILCWVDWHLEGKTVGGLVESQQIQA